MTRDQGLTQDQGTVAWTPHDLIGLEILRPLLSAGGYLPWSSGAMRASGLVSVCNEIVLGPRRRIVELGSGTSTVLLARLLREQDLGGTLDAVEHHAGWADRVNAMLDAEGLSSVARVTLAPLGPHPDALDGLPWYDPAALAAVLEGPAVDLLVVDGPPAFRRSDALARYPALPALLPALAPDAVVVLDDVVRAGEAEIVERWEALSPWRFDRREDEGIAFGRVPAQA
jgi:hypothetical protein